MIILGVDPGKTTGWAFFNTAYPDSFQSWQADRNDFVDIIVPYLEKTGDRLDIACESYVLTSGTMRTSRSDENWSIEQIGVLRHWARRHGHHFELQTAGNAKKFSTDAKLKDIGWWKPGNGHANDAARHVLLYVARHEMATLERLLTTS